MLKSEIIIRKRSKVIKSYVKRGYSARFEFYGHGRSLYEAVVKAKEGFVPRKEHPFVKCSVSAFLVSPDLYGEKGWWTYGEVES